MQVICPSCNKSKNILKFTLGDNRCKKCLSKKARLYRQTKKGWLSVVYSSQKTNSKKRGHATPTYSKEELWLWVKQQKSWKKLWKQYKRSGFETAKKPSIDRKHDDISYDINNIQLMTFEENCKKEWSAHKDGASTNNKDYTPVTQYSMDGEFLATYKSMNIAARATGAHQGNISKVCNGDRNSAGGFIWEYADEK
jgi:hypothetical protein